MNEANAFNQRKPLTKRQKNIVEILVDMDGQSITVKAISERLKVSTRTILRDIPQLETWMDDNDFQFEHKPGVGLLINESGENIELIKELLDIENRTPHYSRSERRQIILGQLFNAEEPVKAFVFTSQLKVSQSTLFTDLDSLDVWLNDYNVSIVRRQGLGIYLDGKEFDLRQAIMNYIFEFCDFDQIPVLIMDKDQKEDLAKVRKNPLLQFFEEKILDCSIAMVTEAEETLNTRYTDGGRIRLIMRYMLAIYRMQRNHYLEQSPLENKRISAVVELSASIMLIQRIEKEFSIRVPKNEVDYFAMHLSTTRIWSQRSDFKDPTNSLDVWQVVMSMTRIVEQMTGLTFTEHTKFIDDLVNHIEVVEKRVNLDLIVENRQTEEIKERDPELFNAVDTACEVLREWMYPKVLRNADVGYIALHFAAEAMRIQEQTQKFNVAVVCPYGVGSSKILAASIHDAFYNVNVVKAISAFQIDVATLVSEDIDLVITTIPLQIDFPTIHVGSILLQTNDKLMIRNELEQLNIRRKPQKKKRTSYLPQLDYSDIQRLTAIGIEIQEILEHLTILQVSDVETKEALLDKAGTMFSDDDIQAKSITDGFVQREDQNDTYIRELQIYLFHCISDEIEHARFGYIQINHPIEENDQIVYGAIVMIVPRQKVAYALEPIGRLSALLVEDKQFLVSLQTNALEHARRFAEKTLVTFYKNEISK